MGFLKHLYTNSATKLDGAINLDRKKEVYHGQWGFLKHLYTNSATKLDGAIILDRKKEVYHGLCFSRVFKAGFLKHLYTTPASRLAPGIFDKEFD